jgi:glycosyltransferase involved in cell wall biosynthesis
MNANVTVIIPCWRCKETITRAVDSVYKQTLLPERVILIDDASGDGTGDFLEQLALNYPKDWITVIHLAVNSGPGVARNAGWDIAITEYIAFLDADDSWHPNKVKLQYEWMLANKDIDLSCHLPRILLNDTTVNLQNSECTKSGCEISQSTLLFKNMIATRSVMLKTNINERFDKKKRLSEDYYLWLKLILSGKHGYLLNETLAYSYKPDFGHSGLSQNLIAMELAELDTFYQCYQLKLINLIQFLMASVFSIIKFAIRCLINISKR